MKIENLNKIYDLLERIKPGEDFRNSDDFLDDMLLESMDIIRIVAELEDMFEFQFDLMDLVPETFMDAESILEVVSKYTELN